MTLDVTFNGGADSLLTGRYTLGFAATGTLLRSTFGLGAYAPAVGDEVTLEIHAEFQRTGAGAAAVDLGRSPLHAGRREGMIAGLAGDR